MKHFYLLIIPLLLQSCSSMYIPAVRSIPLLEKQGEFQGEVGVSTNSVYANGSYAFTDDIAVSINGNLSYRNFTEYYDIFTHKDDEALNVGGSFIYFGTVDYRGKFAHRYGEMSVGKINMLPTRRQKLEIFGGAGIGKATDVEYYMPYKNSDYSSFYYSFFGQGNYGVKHRIIEAGISMRFAYSVFNYTVDLYHNNQKKLYQEKIDVFHAEPMGFFRVGKGNLKVVFRAGINIAETINPIEKDIKFRGFYNGRLDNTIFHLSIGMSYRIAGK